MLGFVAGAAVGAGATWVAAFLRRRGVSPYVPRRVAPPQVPWTPGAPSPTPYGKLTFTGCDPLTMEKAALYPLAISLVVPRPIAFVSTVSVDGVVNLSPFSYFGEVCHNPLVVCIGITRSPSRGSGFKDSFKNIQDTGELVVCIISDWLVAAANHTCGEYAPEVDEMRLAGLTPLPSTKVRPPRVAECAVHMECRVRSITELEDPMSGAPTGSAVLADVVAVHVADAVAARSPSGKLVVDPERLRPVCRLGGVTYGLPTALFDMPRPAPDGSYPPPQR